MKVKTESIYINTEASFNFIHYMANLLGRGRAKKQNKSLLHHFLNKTPFTKKSVASALSFFTFHVHLVIVCVVPPHGLPAERKQIFERKMPPGAE